MNKNNISRTVLVLWAVTLAAGSIGSSPLGAAPEPPPAAVVDPPVDGVLRFRSAVLLNRHLLRTSLKMDMGGIPVTVSGQFNRDRKNGFLVLSSPRFRSPLYFNLKALLEQEVDISLGGIEYRIVVDPSIKGKMASMVKIQPKIDKKGGLEFTVAQLFEATYEAGAPVTLNGAEYRLYYFNEVQGELQGAPADLRDFGLMSKPKDGVYGTFLFPEESVPSDRVRDFPLGAKTLGLKLSGGVLEIHQGTKT